MVDSLDALTAEFQNYIVAPINAFGLGGFLFDTPGESIAHLGAEITDHYTEDNQQLKTVLVFEYNSRFVLVIVICLP